MFDFIAVNRLHESRALQRRGFAWNDIKRALETYGSSLPEEE